MNIKQLKNKAVKLKDEMKDGHKQVLNNTSVKHLKNIKDNTRVDTGALKESMECEVEKDTIVYGTESEYAIFEEYGHLDRSGKYIEGAHMFGKAEKKLDKLIDKEVNKMFDKIDRSW